MKAGIVPGGPDRRLWTNRRDTDAYQYKADIERVRLAVLRQLRNGTDVGEFLIAALAAAQACVEPGSSLTDNRPGSWEAALLESMLEQGGC